MELCGCGIARLVQQDSPLTRTPSVWTILLIHHAVVWILSMSKESVHLWDLQEPEKKQLVASRPSGYQVTLSCMAYSPTCHQVAIGDSNSVVRIFDLRTKSLLRTTTFYYTRPKSLAFSPNGQQLAIGTRTQWIELWDFCW